MSSLHNKDEGHRGWHQSHPPLWIYRHQLTTQSLQVYNSQCVRNFVLIDCMTTNETSDKFYMDVQKESRNKIHSGGRRNTLHALWFWWVERQQNQVQFRRWLHVSTELASVVFLCIRVESPYSFEPSAKQNSQMNVVSPLDQPNAFKSNNSACRSVYMLSETRFGLHIWIISCVFRSVKYDLCKVRFALYNTLFRSALILPNRVALGYSQIS